MNKINEFIEVLRTALPKEKINDYIRGYLDGVLMIIKLYEEYKKSSSLKEED